MPAVSGATIRLAVTLGDPRGIGPEVVAAAARDHAGSAPNVRLVLVGPDGAGDGAPVGDYIRVGRWTPGADARCAGRLAGRAIERAVRLAGAGRVDGLVTGPIDKAALNLAGFAFPGHTEMLAALAGVPRVAMLMAAERTRLDAPLRVVLLTRHMRLAAVPAALDADLVRTQARLTARALADDWRIADPHLALCALNPHASDGGLFGDEEARVLAPAVTGLREDGLRITGPVPADTVFARALAGEFDAVLAPYHDVGMAAFKTVAFRCGVNVTLGLPFVRTAPDHGTALDIAGEGVADPTSMIEAIRLAARLARARLRTVEPTTR